MVVGLVGIPRALGLCLLKQRIEDRGHHASFVNIREFPQYALSGFDGSAFRFDHMDLLEFDCFYLDDLEGRNRFFRGIFGKDIWMELRERYIDFVESEGANVAYQISLLMALSSKRPFINSPRTFLQTRLRTSTLFSLAKAGLPTANIVVEEDRASDESAYLRIRFGEENTYDVPCFPRNFEGCVGLRACDSGDRLRIVVLRGERPSKVILDDGQSIRAGEAGREIGQLAADVLEVLGLETAEVSLVLSGNRFKIMEVLPTPDLAEFEDITGEPISDRIAERLLSMGGAP